MPRSGHRAVPGLWITCYVEAAAGAELDDEELGLSELLDEELDLSDDFVSPAGLLVDDSDDELDEVDESPLELDELLDELFAASRLSLR
jgi:hypothetical protein